MSGEAIGYILAGTVGGIFVLGLVLWYVLKGMMPDEAFKTTIPDDGFIPESSSRKNRRTRTRSRKARRNP